MRVRCRCGKFAKFCDGCGNLPQAEKKLIDEVRRLEMRVEVLKRSIASNERAEKMVFDRYMALREKLTELEKLKH